MVRRFDARVEPHGKTAAFFHVPPEVMDALGPKKRVPVPRGASTATPTAVPSPPWPWHSSCPSTGSTGPVPGSSPATFVEVVLERDDAPRIVEVPDDLAAALEAEAAAGEAFARLSYSHQREYVSGSARPSGPRPGSGGWRRPSSA
jgi:hypothetical protein